MNLLPTAVDRLAPSTFKLLGSCWKSNCLAFVAFKVPPTKGECTDLEDEVQPELGLYFGELSGVLKSSMRKSLS